MSVVYAVLVLGVLGCLFGGGLAMASKVFAVEKDPRVEEIQSTLPGANCGGCGFAGCAACAAAIASGAAPVNACPVCSGEQTSAIAAIMGVEVTAAARQVAFVKCAGGNRAGRKYEYVGIDDCVGAMKIAGNGPLECAYGCLGFGNCVRACAFDAIHINDIGVAATANPKELYENGHRVKLFLDKDLKTAEKLSFHPCENTSGAVIGNADFMRFLEIWGGEYEWLDINGEE